jgi:hypothetical protein
LDLKADLEGNTPTAVPETQVLKSTRPLADVPTSPTTAPVSGPTVEQAVKQEIMKEVSDELELPGAQSSAAEPVSAVDSTLGPGFGSDLYDKKSPEQRTPLVTQTHHEAPANSGLSQLQKDIYNSQKEHMSRTDDA